MKSHVRTLAGLAMIMLGLSLLAAAQMAPGTAAQAPGAADKQELMAKMEQMTTALQLTPQQKQQMAPIMIEEAQKMKAIKTNTSLGPMQKAMQMKQLGTDMDAKVQPILSPEQYQKFQQMRQQEREQMMEKMRSGQ